MSKPFFDIAKHPDFNKSHAIEVLIECVKEKDLDQDVKIVLFQYLNCLKDKSDRHPSCLYNCDECNAVDYLGCHCLED